MMEVDSENTEIPPSSSSTLICFEVSKPFEIPKCFFLRTWRTCGNCSARFSRKKELKAHIRQVHNSGPKTGSIDNDNVVLDESTSNMDSSTDGPCNQKLGRVLRSRDLEVLTSKLSPIKKRYKCPHCPKTFCSRYGVNRHVKACHWDLLNLTIKATIVDD